ncbi:MAG: WD40 repeat domain-containing protein [Actinomycetota bacterium]|nr:WD40 repeat domain-containing protein [Actinomycetota bacterium]
MAIWDTASWQLVTDPIGGGGQIVLASYSLDGRWLVTVSSEGKIVFRDPETLQPDGGPLVGNTDAVTGFSHGPFFTLDGDYMITTADGQGRLWNLTERTQIGAPFPNVPGPIAAASVTGQVLATFTTESVIIWDLDISRWFDIACAAAGRNLDFDEWAQFGPTGQAHEPTCDQWPAAKE